MKSFIALLFNSVLFIAFVNAQNPVQLQISQESQEVKISRNIYGHFSEHLGRCIYDGFWIDSSVQVAAKDRIRLDIVNALKNIRCPLLRWPGGCFADQYHWTDGVGPREKRPKRVNTTWGMVTEDNSFGTQEFLQLCELIGCEPYVAGNVGTGSPREMANWLEYLNFDGNSQLANERRANGHEKPYKVSFWGVGNESWGCGGAMIPSYYSDQYRRYAEFCKNYPGTSLKKIASGSNVDDYNWTEVCMKNIPLHMMWGISLHFYTLAGNWQNKGSATNFGEDEYFKAVKNSLFMNELIEKHSAIMDKYDPEKKVSLCVDEWGIWTDVEPGTNPAFLHQQNSMRDAIIAASTLNIFNNHAERVRLACLAQTVNVLQSLILTKGDKMILTPTYYVFDLYKVHQDAVRLKLNFSSPAYNFGNDKIPAISSTASKDSNGVIHITLVNTDPHHGYPVSTSLSGFKSQNISGKVLTSLHVNDVNTFEKPDLVKTADFKGFKRQGDQLVIELPPLSIVMLQIK